jgi:hypothetical protein
MIWDDDRFGDVAGQQRESIPIADIEEFDALTDRYVDVMNEYRYSCLFL